MTDYAMYKGERFIDLGRIHSAIQERSKKMKQKRLDYTTDENINNLALIIIEKN